MKILYGALVNGALTLEKSYPPHYESPIMEMKFTFETYSEWLYFGVIFSCSLMLTRNYWTFIRFDLNPADIFKKRVRKN